MPPVANQAAFSLSKQHWEFTSARQYGILKIWGDRMSNREVMLSALKAHTFVLLKEKGFTGRYPNFRRKLDNCIELISFQTNKWGGSFTIEVSAVFPGSVDPNYTLYEGVTEDTLGVEATNKQYRLPGMYDGWFYYRDVYRKRTLFFGSL